MTITLPGQSHIIEWAEDSYKSAADVPDVHKWYGAIQLEANPPCVNIWKKCSTAPYSSVHIIATLNGITIKADGDITFSLLEASDFSIAMIEALKTLKYTDAHAKGELYGPHSDGDIRYE